MDEWWVGKAHAEHTSRIFPHLWGVAKGIKWFQSPRVRGNFLCRWKSIFQLKFLNCRIQNVEQGYKLKLQNISTPLYPQITPNVHMLTKEISFFVDFMSFPEKYWCRSINLRDTYSPTNSSIFSILSGENHRIASFGTNFHRSSKLGVLWGYFFFQKLLYASTVINASNRKNMNVWPKCNKIENSNSLLLGIVESILESSEYSIYPSPLYI